MRRRWIITLALGCESQSGEWSSNSAGGGSTDETSAGGGSTDETSSGESGPPQQACMLPKTPADQDRVIRLRNAADHPIWLQGWHCRFPFDIEGPEADVTWSIYGQCDSCESVLADGCESWCEDHCDGVAIRVEPGGVYERVWSRRLWETITLDCEGCDAMCDVAEVAPDGEYVAHASVSGSCTPPPRPDPVLPACDCTPDASGSCELFLPIATFADEVPLDAAFSWPGVDPVELVFR